MDLTAETRLILVNQYRILAKLDPTAADEAERAIDALQSGYELEYANLAMWLASAPMSEAACREVREILEMHRELRWAFEDLTDKSQVEEGDVAFRGFDGNNEVQALGYARFLIDEHNWAELRGSGDGLNSHMPVMEMYRRMLPVWRRVVDRRRADSPSQTGHDLLTASDIREISSARVHPSSSAVR